MKTNILLIIAIFFSFSVLAQNQPVVLAIDGVNTTFQSGLSLPYWLKAGQTLNVVANASSVSIMEFTEDTTSLKYSRVISLNSLQTVPSGKIWKIEAIGTIGGTEAFSTTSIPTIFTSPKTFSTPGTYSWTVPPNVTNICVEVWGGGGNGGMNISSYSPFGGGGGGGGAYGYQCLAVVPGTVLTVTVGGPSGTSSVGGLISATGGAPGMDATTTSNGAGGAGGVSTATYNISGSSGLLGGIHVYPGSGIPYNYAGLGGSSGNGNNIPAAGGGGKGSPGGYGQTTQPQPGGQGTTGLVIIHW
jgi:hypothetical protein